MKSKDGLISHAPHEQRYRWVILSLVWLVYFAFGTVFRSIGPLLTPILEDLNLSYSQMGLIIGAWPFTYIAVAIVAGTVIDRLGVRKSILIGVAIIALSTFMRYFPTGFWSMWLAVALFGIGGPLISIGSPKAIAQWFRGKERGTAVGIYMTGPRVGELFSFTLANSLIMPLMGYSWRLTFVFFGAIAFAVASIWWLLSRDIRSKGDEKSVGVIEVLRGLIRVRNVRIVLVMAPLSLAIGHGFINWLPNVLETSGFSAVEAGYVASIPSIACIPAVLIVPHLTPSHLRGRVVALLGVVGALALPMVVLTSGPALIVALVLVGMTAFIIMPLLTLILMDIPEVGSRYMGSAAGMFFCVGEIGGLLGPYLMGVLVELTGGFLAGVSLFAAMGLGISAMTFLLKTKKKVEATIN